MEPLIVEVFEAGGCFDLRLCREDCTDQAALVVLSTSDESELRAEGEACFGEGERAYWTRELAPARRRSFLLGRIAAHRAVRQLLPPGSPAPAIDLGIFGQPVIFGAGNLAVSISHSGSRAVAIAFPGTHPLALDLETIDDEHLKALTSVLTQDEMTLAREVSASDGETEESLLFALWSAREALSKVLGCGFMCSGRVLAVASVEPLAPGCWRGAYAHFGQWAFVARRFGDQIFALVHPKRTRLEWLSPDGGEGARFL